MDDPRVGAAFRAVRLRRRWRQSDVAAKAGVSRGTVSALERGHLERMPLATIRSVARVLDVRIDVVARWRGADLHRLLNARHSALAESVVRFLVGSPPWLSRPEVSFPVYGERGVIDILAFHPPTCALLVVEVKTDVLDANELVGTLDRKTRLAAGIAGDSGWQATTVSRWVIITRDKTNQRRIDEHRAMLRAAFPQDGHAVRSWLHHPTAAISVLSMWSGASTGDPSPTRSHRVRLPEA